MNRKDSTYYKFRCGSSEYSELAKIRDFISENALGHGIGEEIVSKVALAVDEACANLIRHAYKLDKSHEICISLQINPDNLEIDILDDGQPFNPLEVPTQNMKDYFDRYQKGGLGIHIIKKIMDEIVYIPSDTDHPQNILKLIKQVKCNC
ncbi:MAG: ATP-binding protein [Candidatus Kapabacteria bacterium]|nr:ATP-binding protein [Candidatus Kapabacteria bacterium]